MNPKGFPSMVVLDLVTSSVTSVILNVLNLAKKFWQRFPRTWAKKKIPGKRESKTNHENTSGLGSGLGSKATQVLSVISDLLAGIVAGSSTPRRSAA
jgi:hypothetical protein